MPERATRKSCNQELPNRAATFSPQRQSEDLPTASHSNAVSRKADAHDSHPVQKGVVLEDYIHENPLESTMPIDWVYAQVID